MHFRNGAVAFEYVATLLMEYVDEHKVTLNDTIDRWMPTLPEANKVTLKMLANQTTGYPDFETDPAWTAAFNADPFQIWTSSERLKYAFARPVQFAPGTNWSYSHTNFMILGEILSKIGHEPLDTLCSEKVLEPDGPDQHHQHRDFRYPRARSCIRSAPSAGRRSRSPGPLVLRGGHVLERPMGDADRGERDHGHQRHGHDRGRGRHRRAAVEIELPRHDRPEPAGLRAHAVQLRAQLFQADTSTTSASASCGPDRGCCRTRC